jgi:hypothetical protein
MPDDSFVDFSADFQGALEKDSNGFTNSFSVPVGPRVI